MKVQTTVRIEDSVLKEAKEIFSCFGMTISDAVNMFLAKSVLEQGLPFSVTLPQTENPSEDLAKRIANLKNGKNTEDFSSSQELFEELGI